VSGQFYYILTVNWQQAGTDADGALTRTGTCTVQPGDTFGSVFTRVYGETATLARLDGADPGSTGFRVAYFDLRPETPLILDDAEREL
jgi:hypothetical protein